MMSLWQVGLVAFVALCLGVRFGYWLGRQTGWEAARRRFQGRGTVREA